MCTRLYNNNYYIVSWILTLIGLLPGEKMSVYAICKEQGAQWKLVRVDVWTAMASDDVQLLAAALASAAAQFNTTEADVLFQLKRRLWRNIKGKRQKNRSTGKTEYKERGLLEECAGNYHAGEVNAPDYGASKCIQWLCENHRDSWEPQEITWAMRRAKRLGRSSILQQLLQLFPEYEDIKDANGFDIRRVAEKSDTD